MITLRILLLIGFGGGIGSIFRYLTASLVHKYYAGIFPLATLLINVLGSFLIGIIFGAIERHELSNPDLKFLFITGFCGGYTTFSAFAFENFSLFQSNETFTALAYIGLSLFLGLFATWAGIALVK
ncbi:MAG: crcB [Chitinophagaceae bacterium]|nr:crcB [Chitinophagaceae bacterium]